jgi:protein NrfC
MARGKLPEANKAQGKKYSRRDFVIGSGTIIAGGALTAYSPRPASAAGETSKDTYPLSTGYLVYDSRRCAGCQSCMLVCSLVHDGESSTSLSRIQVSRAVLTRYPYDIQISVCRQCPEPMCVQNCGNCLKACPHTPHRTIWNPIARKSTKCDLCANAPYFSKQGGPAGAQACVTTCPMGALKLVAELPLQTDISGYDVDLAPPPSPKTAPGAKPKASASAGSGH